MDLAPPGARHARDESANSIMEERRVVITGIGVISPNGNDLTSFWDSMKNGRSGIDTITALDCEPYSCKIAGEVRDFDPKGFYKNPKDARRSDRYTHLAIAASKMALEDSGMDPAGVDKHRVGVMVGSGIGGLQTLSLIHI